MNTSDSHAKDAFAALQPGETVPAATMDVTRESIRAFGEATLDFNPLHFDEGVAAKGGVQAAQSEVIAHGMSTFSLITRMLTDWTCARDAEHRRLETRWRLPAKPGDTLRAEATVRHKLETAGSRWVVLDVEVRNQRGEVIASGEATAEFPGPTRSQGSTAVLSAAATAHLFVP